MRLEKFQRNDLLKAIAAAGLDPRDFELDNDSGSDAEGRLNHRGSESYFTLGGDATRYSGTHVVGEQPPWPYEVYSWRKVKDRVSQWLDEVKHDIETPDLWAELERERELLSNRPADAIENAPFTVKEQAEISKQLRQMEGYAKETYALSEIQAQELKVRLDYLDDAASRLGRLDWRAAALGTLLTLAVEAILPPEGARHILLMLLQSLGHLFGHPIPELPSGY